MTAPIGRSSLRDGTPVGVHTTVGVAAIGGLVDVGGFGLSGVRVCHAVTSEEVRTAWEGLPAEISLVILDAAAAEHLVGHGDDGRLTVVMPQ